MNLLYLIPRDLYLTKMSRVRIAHASWLDRHDRINLKISGPGWDDWQPTLSPADNIKQRSIKGGAVDVVLAYKVGGLAGCTVPVVIAYNEAFEYHVVNREIDDVGAHIVVFHHESDRPRYAHLDGRGIVRLHIPHGADPETFRDYGEEKTIDILVAGNLSQSYYPFRHRLMRIATTILRRRAWRVEILKHPGYTLPAKAGTYVGAEFATMLNRAKLVLTCSMRYKYQLAKYAEIAMCRAVPVGDMPDECEPCTARLEQMILRVEPWMTDAEIVRTIESALEDEEGLERRMNVAREIATRDLSMARYAERFYDGVAPVVERLLTQWRQDHEAATVKAASVRVLMRDDVPPGTKILCAYPDDAGLTVDEKRAVTREAIYTVEKIYPRAPACVSVCELPGLVLPIALFREAEG